MLMKQFEKIQGLVVGSKEKMSKKMNNNVIEQQEYIIAMKYIYLKTPYHIVHCQVNVNINNELGLN